MRGTHTIHESLTNAEKASKSDIGKLLKSMSKILLKKSLTLLFIQCRIVVINGARMKIVCTALLKYGQHSIHWLII